MSNLWAIQFRASRGRPWINFHTIRDTKRGAWQACLELMGDDPDRKWWEEVHARRGRDELRVVKVRIEVVE